MVSFLKNFLSRFGFGRYLTECWVCSGMVEVRRDDPQASNHQDTLGGAFSFPGCPSCKSRRATTPARAAELEQFPEVSGDPVPFGGFENRANMERYLTFRDADGSRAGVAIHVFDAGRYVPLPNWMAGEKHAALVRETKDRYRSVRNHLSSSGAHQALK